MKSKGISTPSFQKKLAGLVAVGAAGGLAQGANAAIQYFDITDASVGVGNLANLTIDLAGDNDIKINFSASTATSTFSYVIFMSGGPLIRATSASAPAVFAFGDNTNAAGNQQLAVPNISWVGTNPTSASQVKGSSFSNQFYMFRFDDTSDSNTTKYGWMGVSLSIDTTTKPVLTVHDYAYDDSGATITAGQTVIPEPSVLSLGAAAAALLLGGRRGARSWRKRKSETAA